MASLCGRIALRTSSLQSISHISVRFCKRMNDPLEHATGLEKQEMLAKAAGNDNPFDMRVLKRGAGTKENPNLIPSSFDARIVGCICEEDQTYIQWMWLQKGTCKRCECGHWFKLVEKAPAY